MTTLVGIVARKGTEGVVIATDVIGTYTGWHERGDFAVKVREQAPFSKTFVDDKQTVAIAAAGTYDPDFLNLMHNFKTGKLNLGNAIMQGQLFEFERLHLKRANGRILNPENTNSLLMATRFGEEPRLYSCWPMGRIDHVDFHRVLGSGSGHAEGYLNESLAGKVERDIGLPEAIEHARKAVEVASRDIYTKGLTLTVVTKDSIDLYASRIKNAMDKALDREVINIANNYN